MKGKLRDFTSGALVRLNAPGFLGHGAIVAIFSSPPSGDYTVMPAEGPVYQLPRTTECEQVETSWVTLRKRLVELNAVPAESEAA